MLCGGWLGCIYEMYICGEHVRYVIVHAYTDEKDRLVIRYVEIYVNI